MLFIETFVGHLIFALPLLVNTIHFQDVGAFVLWYYHGTSKDEPVLIVYSHLVFVFSS